MNATATKIEPRKPPAREPKRLPEGLVRRGKTYYANFRANGRRIRQKLSSDLRIATQALYDLRARADKGQLGIIDNDCPWAPIKEEFLAWIRQNNRDAKQYAHDLENLERFARLTNVRQITQAHIVAYRSWRLGQTIESRRKQTDPGKPGQAKERPAKLPRYISPRTVNREVATFQNLLNRAVRLRMIGINPLAGMKPLRHDRHVKQRRSLTAAEVESLFEASPDDLRTIWRMFLTTGMRRDELIGLLFSDVDFDRHVVIIPAHRSKNHKAREIPLDDEMMAVIRKLRDEAPARKVVGAFDPRIRKLQQQNFSNRHVFVTRANTPWKNNLLTRFYTCCRRAGIEGAEPGGDVDLHSLRVSCATFMLEGGANPRAVQAILGHSTLQMTMGIYAKATEYAKRDAVNALPFATSSTPNHVLPVLAGRKMATRVKTCQQTIDAQQVA